MVTAGAPGNFALFFYGAGQIQAPFGDGFRCVSAGGIGTFRLNPALTLDALGDASRLVGFTQPPASSGAGAIHSGDTWYFQCWHRDPAAAGSGFNLSDGLSVSFCP